MIQILYMLAKNGLIHRKRMCELCVIYPCSLVYDNDPSCNYAWRCNVCFATYNMTHHTILAGLNVRTFD